MADESIPRKPKIARKMTVNLVSAAAESLDRAAQRDELSLTDTVNRALQLYDKIREEQEKGQELYLGPNDLTAIAKVDGDHVIVALIRLTFV